MLYRKSVLIYLDNGDSTNILFVCIESVVQSFFGSKNLCVQLNLSVTEYPLRGHFNLGFRFGNCAIFGMP